MSYVTKRYLQTILSCDGCEVVHEKPLIEAHARHPEYDDGVGWVAMADPFKSGLDPDRITMVMFHSGACALSWFTSQLTAKYPEHFTAENMGTSWNRSRVQSNDVLAAL